MSTSKILDSVYNPLYAYITHPDRNTLFQKFVDDERTFAESKQIANSPWVEVTFEIQENVWLPYYRQWAIDNMPAEFLVEHAKAIYGEARTRAQLIEFSSDDGL